VELARAALADRGGSLGGPSPEGQGLCVRAVLRARATFLPRSYCGTLRIAAVGCGRPSRTRYRFPLLLPQIAESC
jgi:hypothetical protein